MPEIDDDVPFLLRDRRIKAVRDRFHRPPTANELRAIDALPLELRKNLNDTSPNGQKIYDLLKAFEKNGYIEGLEEAGRLLWAQVFAEPDFSQMPRREPISTTGDTATSEYAEVRYTASRRASSQPKEKPAQLSAAEEVLSINTTSNAFSGSSHKSWMTKGVSVSPSPRRASISSTENDKNDGPATSDFQPQSTPPIPFCPAQSGQQTQNHAFTFVGQFPGASPNIYSSGVYTSWSLNSNFQEHQYASPYSSQGPTSSMSSVQERRDETRDPISHFNYTSNELNEYDRAMVNPYDTTKSHYFATLESNRRDPNPFPYSAPQHLPSRYQTSGMSSPANNYAHPAPSSMRKDLIQPSNDTVYPNHTIPGSSGKPYDPSTPPFHPAISPQAQALFSRKEEKEKHKLARITSNIHQSLSNLPESHGSQQVTSSSGMAAANTPENMANTDQTSQAITPNASNLTYESPYSATSSSSMTPEESSSNPFVIRGDMGFIRTFQSESGPNSIPIIPQPITSERICTSSSTDTDLTATVPNPLQHTSKKARTPLPNARLPQFGKSIPDKPSPGTIFSTNTKHDLLVSKPKRGSMQALIFLPPEFPQIDRASGSASYQYDKTDYSRLPTKNLNVDLDVQANYTSHLPAPKEPSFSYRDSSLNTTAEFTFFDPYNDNEDTYTA
ncbi:39f1e17d-d573-49ca-bd81-0d0bb2d275b8 [Sclerotinia trifoliorum]|uniref:39f1e17d-d573-49ca-bd81-0d0bb2d275b8 n=1 Tax=Sclerotinia trifoliorum TaxID=28548 RepID=A0A8H2VSK0_9HELO|nr:39f1e17d-d573-49ca-bd81-0d0bb2d275b8 [Sclerotinia trifoliorum]